MSGFKGTIGTGDYWAAKHRRWCADQVVARTPEGREIMRQMEAPQMYSFAQLPIRAAIESGLPLGKVR